MPPLAVSTEVMATWRSAGSGSPAAASAALVGYSSAVLAAAACMDLSSVVMIWRPPPWISASLKPFSSSSFSTSLIRKPFQPP